MPSYYFPFDQVSGSVVEEVLQGKHATVAGPSSGFWNPPPGGAKARARRPYVQADYNHVIFYGQSLAVGVGGLPAMTTTNTYSKAVTFTAGPKATIGVAGLNEGTSGFKLLVEDEAKGDTYAAQGRGETPCSGTANRLFSLLQSENGVTNSDANHWVFSTAGKGATPIDELRKGATTTLAQDPADPDVEYRWYDNFIGHATAAKAICDGQSDSYKVAAVCFMQGEGDNTSGTSVAAYKAHLEGLIAEFKSDVKAATGQSEDPIWFLYQTYGRTDNDPLPYASQAQFELARDHPDVYLVQPIQRFERSADNSHLTEQSYYLFGWYVGRALKDVLIGGRHYTELVPYKAEAVGTEITISFSVPQSPLIFDGSSDDRYPVTDEGFLVKDDTGTLTLSNITARSNTVTMTVNRALGSNPVVRYGMDYIGSGETPYGTTTGSASGTLRDSESETTVVDEATKELFRIAPHFQLEIAT